MTQFLFSIWLSHFICALGKRGGISLQQRHLLIVDGHNSHVTTEVIKKAMEVGLDLLILPAHISHRLQPLDIAIFAPYKRAFRYYKDAWMLQNLGCPATKKVLAMWVNLGLHRALSFFNIQGGFRSTGIWPYNSYAVDKFFGPSRQFVSNNPSTSREGDN